MTWYLSFALHLLHALCSLLHALCSLSYGTTLRVFHSYLNRSNVLHLLNIKTRCQIYNANHTFHIQPLYLKHLQDPLQNHIDLFSAKTLIKINVIDMNPSRFPLEHEIPGIFPGSIQEKEQDNKLRKHKVPKATRKKETIEKRNQPNDLYDLDRFPSILSLHRIGQDRCKVLWHLTQSDIPATPSTHHPKSQTWII